MPTGLKADSKLPRGQKTLIRRMMQRRAQLGLSAKAVAEQSGYYCRAMIGLLEKSLTVNSPRMSMRGMESIERWLAKTEKSIGRKRAA